MMKFRTLNHSIIFLLIVFPVIPVTAQELPELTSLNARDILFQQVSDDIQTFYRWQAGTAVAPQLSIYQYTIKDGDTLFSLAARLNLPQSSIATINRLNSPKLPSAGTTIFIPNIPGMFIPEEPASDFEQLLSQRVLSDEGTELSEKFIIPTSDTAWYFIVADDFTGIERRAFLDILFQDPLPGAYISSAYGLRKSPITGEYQFHYGLDLAAPGGTPVRSIAEGVVTVIGSDPVFGQYIRIQHSGGYESLYAHLYKIHADLNEEVQAGEHVAEVGSSGMSTGTHLHLEIFYLGRNRDPQIYIRKKR